MSRNVTPAVRALADTFGVDLEKVTGSGAGGRVTTNDVRKAHERQAGRRQAAAQYVGEAITAEQDRQLSAMLAIAPGSLRD